MDVHKAVALFEVTDMEAFKEIFTKPKAADFHFKQNLADTFYKLEKLSWLNTHSFFDGWQIDRFALVDREIVPPASRPKSRKN